MHTPSLCFFSNWPCDYLNKTLVKYFEKIEDANIKRNAQKATEILQETNDDAVILSI